MKHRCPEYNPLNDGDGVSLGYGAAIGDTLYLDDADGRWYADNGEYWNVGAFCPYCGIRLRDLEGGS